MNEKKGLSPVIATVMLVGIVVVSGLIVFTWFQGFTQEAVTKFDQNAQLVCNDIEFQASLAAGAGDRLLSVSNVGNVPIYGLLVKLEGPSGFETRDIKELDKEGKWSDGGIGVGGVAAINLKSEDISGKSSLTVVPILRGSSQKGGEASYVCNEARHGQKEFF